MPRFINASGRWIAVHTHDGEDNRGKIAAEEAHNMLSRRTKWNGETFIEIADDLGDPCTIFPNAYGSDG